MIKKYQVLKIDAARFYLIADLALNKIHSGMSILHVR